ncbi:hypothetical protein H4R19_002742, partial [Coemansia spiralis]
LQTAKFTSHVGERGEIIYSEAGNPLWVKAELHGSGEARLVPTVYTQWRFPGLLPVVWTGANVVDKLVGGADLMTAGLLVPDGGMAGMKKGTVVAVCCPGSRAAQAIGVLDLDTAGIRSVVGAKGKAVLVVHTYKDCLWEAGDKSAPPADDSAPADTDSGDDDNHEIGNSGAAEEPPAANEAANEAVNEAAEVSPAETDALLMTALKQVMATVLDASHAPPLLPITSSVLYSGYMVPNAPSGATIDIKRSSYKKLGKFLKAAEKHGLLQLKDIRGEPHVKSFNWAHADMADYKPYRVRHAAKGAAASGSGGTNAAAADQVPSGEGTIGITELLKPPQALIPLFDAVSTAAPPSGYYTRQQARGVLEDYVRSRSLADPKRPRDVRIDYLVCDGLLTKGESIKLTTFPRDKLHARLQEKMTLFTQLSIPGKAPSVRPGPPPSVDIVCERRTGNKVVTRAVGLEAYGIDPTNVAKELRTMCASSTAVDPVPGKKDAQAVLVQGHHVVALTKLLAKHGLPAELLRVTDKSGKTPKKQPQQQQRE